MTKASDLPVNAVGLVPIRFLGIPLDPSDPSRGRAGEAGLGLRVGQIMGVLPDVAARMINLDTAELIDKKAIEAKAAAKAKASAAASPKPATA